ncbi:PREDICTED: uncharacterized protein C17orf67 homolog isoform X2 [Dipodomys ordii]|uniref:Uncharacterized protein C17orf67 homolog isoform X2 n=1 Tax=Dipodomys ordii TaxID=10020 RepID=A0A1S3GY73_DIPOR|nr:PREDICTED: uncharacterized protein C17orf67 homolog isoform X2 [Dipodomys ordii]
MGKLVALVLALALLPLFSEASPILSEKQAKQLLRSRRQDRPSKPGFPDEPMRQARGTLRQCFFFHLTSNRQSRCLQT